MSKLTKYSAGAASDIDEDEIWFWDTLSDLHEQAKDIIAEHMARLKGK